GIHSASPEHAAGTALATRTGCVLRREGRPAAASGSDGAATLPARTACHTRAAHAGHPASHPTGPAGLPTWSPRCSASHPTWDAARHPAGHPTARAGGTALGGGGGGFGQGQFPHLFIHLPLRVEQGELSFGGGLSILIQDHMANVVDDRAEIRQLL